jgi:hypothetical protein
MSKTPSKTTKNTKVVSKVSNATLYVWNKWLAIIYAIQGVAILLLSTTKLFPLTTSYLSVDELASEAAGSQVLSLATRTLTDVNIAYLVAAVLFIAALTHGFAAWWCRKFYENDLNRSVNRMRWIGGAANASLVLVIVAMLVGVADLSVLIMIAALSVLANLIGLFIDIANTGKNRVGRLPAVTAVIAGLIPWVAIAMYLIGAGLYDGLVPKFVCWIFISLFILFGLMVFNAWMQYKKQGKWANYLYGERICIVLSFVAITALTWQIFFGALRP